MAITEIAGFAGAGLAGAAYVPQISHLIRARCSAGISRLAFEVWLLASVLTTARAIAIGAAVFIVLGGIQIVATALIMLCAIRYKDTLCPIHLPGRTTAMTAARAGTSGNEPGSSRLPGRPVAESATPAGHGGALRGYVPVPHRRSFAVTARPGPEPDAQAVGSWPRPQTAAAGVTANGRGSSLRSGRSPGGVARARAAERCANAAVHTFGRAPDFRRHTWRGTT